MVRIDSVFVLSCVVQCRRSVFHDLTDSIGQSCNSVCGDVRYRRETDLASKTTNTMKPSFFLERIYLESLVTQHFAKLLSKNAEYLRIDPEVADDVVVGIKSDGTDYSGSDDAPVCVVATSSTMRSTEE